MAAATAETVARQRRGGGQQRRGALGRRLGAALATACLVLVTWVLPGPTGPALAADNPQLLPDHPTPVIDLAKALTDGERGALESELEDFEATSGWKLRVLTQYERTPGLAVKGFWDLDERSLLLVADPRGGNLLNFNVGEALFALMPRTFWVELQTRYGNQFYVRDHGEDGSILSAIHAVKGCLAIGGCQVVPGLPQEQWILTLCTSILGGLIVGFAAFPRQEGRRVEWTWVLLLSPLWVILFVALGMGPIITRTHDVLPLLRNVLGFLGAAVLAYLIAQKTLGGVRLEGKGEG
ncbi:TPM domain-containing protein [Cyanobium gracile UHCC 0139]|uniref:TPM domain-containing protein n=1 Tax=Cyanobium gracile UHCC 0139 TaxID=3110308 RepID=A0ABU5RSE0_9CYAN|nr:TPM domain-containing protein [Cyanobium gracile]MEA5390668.1 TPM domain-containing protein [Cyanobium gracile UHCC 0139]